MNLSFDVIFLWLTTVDSMTTGVPLFCFHEEKELKTIYRACKFEVYYVEKITK